ncbi:MAG: hypothetical protein JWM81_945 [Candidatus Saccharibacteria bacterium]|nr:hypothetical protein [Candidatus Saccharibacteria bacterium]
MAETVSDSNTLDPVAAELAKILTYYLDPVELSDEPDASYVIELKRIEEARRQSQQ